MDDTAALGLVAWILIGSGLLVGAVAVTGGILYATDFALEATIVDKDCGGSSGPGTGGPLGIMAGPQITAKTKLFGIEHTLQDVPLEQCAAIQVGNYVNYHIRSERTIVYQSEGGRCIFDTHPDWPLVCGE